MNDIVKSFLRKNRLLSVIIVFCFLLLILSFFFLKHWQKESILPEKLLSCFTSSNEKYSLGSADAPCLERVVKELMAAYSLDDLLKYITASSTPAGAHIYAHTIAHFGRKQIFLESESVETALDSCIALRWYGAGCIHGVIGAAMAKELGISPAEADEIVHTDPAALERIAKEYCASDSFQRCHAVGHIIFEGYRDYTKIPESCDSVTKQAVKREACARGAFMEAAGSVGALFATERQPVSEPKYRSLCKQVPSPYQHACFWYLPWFQNTLFERDDVNSAPERLAFSKGFCGELEGPPRADCIESIGLNARGIFRDADHPDRKYFCDQFDVGADKQACTLGVIGSFLNGFDFNGGVNYCHTTTDSKLQNFCYNALFQIAEENSKDSAMRVVCDEKSTPKECGQKLKDYLASKGTLPNYVFGLYGDR